jgi:hypothetical protein
VQDGEDADNGQADDLPASADEQKVEPEAVDFESYLQAQLVGFQNRASVADL